MAVINDRLVRSFKSGNLILMDESGEKFVGKKKKREKKKQQRPLPSYYEQWSRNKVIGVN